MGSLPQTYISEQMYLEQYANDDTHRYEYIDGQVYAMAGASRNHNILTVNLVSLLKAHLKGTSCTPFVSDMKVKADERYYYPDVVVDCSDTKDNILTEPVLIMEVLSSSTANIDRYVKLQDYQKIPTLQEYVLLEQDFMVVTVYRKADDWKASIYQKDDDVPLDSIGLTLTMKEVYEEVAIKPILTIL
ncbi:MAG: Uma2 family endonuclease [Moraxella equi]|nr:Uma2 family endonuclease [Moraxella equi]